MADPFLIRRITLEFEREFTTVRVTVSDEDGSHGRNHSKEFQSSVAVVDVIKGIVDGSLAFWDWPGT